MVNQVWGKHVKVVTGGDDGSKQVSQSEWNENLNRKGLLGFDSETIASASAITIPDNTSNDVSSFIKLSGTTSVDTFVTTNTSEGDLLYIITTGSVTLNNNTSPSASEIRLLGNANKDLSTTVPTILMRIGSAWYEYGGVLTFGAGDLTGTTLASGVVTTSATTVGALNSGSITSGFGNIDIGSSDFDTSGTVTCDVTGNVSGTSATVTAGTQAAITTCANLVTTGTIGTGVWQGTTVADGYGGTGQSTYATGDLIYASGADTLAKLAVGSNTDVLTLAGGVPTWATAGGGGGVWSFLEGHTFNGSETEYTFTTDFNNTTYTEFHIVARGYMGTGGDMEIAWDGATNKYYGVLRKNGSQTLTSDSSTGCEIGSGLSTSYHNHFDIYISAHERTAGTSYGTTDTGQNIQTSAFGRVNTNSSTGVLSEIILRFSNSPASTFQVSMYGLANS